MHTPHDSQFYGCEDHSFDFGTTDNIYGNEHQLSMWAYETSDENITVAEKFEKANWEAERLERL